MTTNAKITAADRNLAEFFCAERCAQAGDPPCSKVSAGPHCDECIGMAMIGNNHAAAAVAEREALIVKLRAENERLSKAALSQVTRELLAEDENSALLEFVKTLRGDHLKDTTPHAG